jgi:rRNA-processing protein FCF1
VYLIDGYNLLHAMGAARDALLSSIEAFCRRESQGARVVFDATGGMKRRENRGPLEIRVVAEGRKADEEILAAIEATTDRTAWTLVSNDLELVKAAEARKIRVLACRDFAALLAAPPSEDDEKRPPGGDVDFWMKEFGLEEDPPSPSR